MSIEVWLQKGKKVEVGGKELIMMPLPLIKLYKILDWVELNSNDVVKEVIEESKNSKDTVPNPMVMVSKVLGRVDVASVALEIFSYPKDPDTRDQINKGISKEFFEEYLDIPTAHKLVMLFVELNQVENIIKNLLSLPIVKKVAEAASLAFGIPYLNSLQQNMDSTQSKLEGLHSHKSTDTSMLVDSGKQEIGEQKKTQVM